MLVEKETLNNIIIGVLSVPFSTYTTFDEFQLDYQYTILTSFTETASNSTTNFNTFGSGRQGSVIGQGGGAGGGFNYRIDFIENVGFSSIFANSNTNIDSLYAFSDYETQGVDRLTTTINTCTDCTIRSTTETELTTTILGVSTTWTDVTSQIESTQIEYTDISSYEEYPTQINPYFVAYTFKTSGDALVIQPQFGVGWTQDGSKLQYLELFTNTGTYKPFDAIIIKDNDEDASTFNAEKTEVVYNLALAYQYNTEITVISSSAQTFTYEYLDTTQEIITFSTSYYFDYPIFYTLSDFQTQQTFSKKIAKTTSSVQTVQDIYTFINEDYPDSTMFSLAYYTDTRAIAVYTTDVFYYADQFLSYFNLLTYSGLIVTTSSQKYVAVDYGTIGTKTRSGRTATLDSATEIGFTTILYPETKTLYKRFESIEIGTTNSEWNKYYTQYSPNFNFVVGGTSNSIGSYVKLSPSSLITKLYFTTYKFERTGAVNAPTLAVPIDYTSTSETPSGSIYTYQNAIFENEFLMGTGRASIYWTLSTEASISSSSITSYTLEYSGSESRLTIGDLSLNDFTTNLPNQVPYEGKIYHTNGIVNMESGASWLKDGYYYWGASDRTTSGSVGNPISAIGNGRVITFVHSYLQGGQAFPVVSNLKEHINSYNNI